MMSGEEILVARGFTDRYGYARQSSHDDTSREWNHRNRKRTPRHYAESEPIANDRASVAFERIGEFVRVIATTISARLKDDGIRPVIYPAHSDPQSRARAQATPGHFPLAFHADSLPFLEATLRRVLALLANFVFVYPASFSQKSHFETEVPRSARLWARVTMDEPREESRMTVLRFELEFLLVLASERCEN